MRINEYRILAMFLTQEGETVPLSYPKEIPLPEEGSTLAMEDAEGTVHSGIVGKKKTVMKGGVAEISFAVAY